jgi:hypothetical protein
MQEWVDQGNADWNLLRNTSFKRNDIDLAGRSMDNWALLLKLDDTRRSSWS